jgi:chromate transporter
MIYLHLFITYFKIGLFGFGGGHAMLSLIQHEVVDRRGWVTAAEFTDVVVLSQMTPGPIGVNSATYIGYAVTGNVWGAALASFAVCLPSIIIVSLIIGNYRRFRSNVCVNDALRGLRPTVVGLIAAAALFLMNSENFIDFKSLIIFGLTFLLMLFTKAHPVGLILLAGMAGLFLY